MNEWTPMKTKRRSVVKGLAALPLAQVLADKSLAEAVADTLDTVTITTAGGQEVSGSIAMPEVTPAPTLILIHEWWGLRDEIKAVAAEYAKQGFIAVAIDLYKGQNVVDDDPMKAVKLTQTVKDDEAIDTLSSWNDWLRKHPDSTGKVGTVGWCFGGKWSLNASMAAPVDATVIYYGNVTRTADQLSTLEGPVLAHFGTLDKFIPKKMVDGFTAAMDEAGKTYTIHWYEADHAFSNPTSAVYDQEDAKLSWERTLAFLNEQLKS